MFVVGCLCLDMIFSYKNLSTIIFLFFLSSCSLKDDTFTNEGALILTHDSVDREYLLHVPENYDSTISHPIVFNFHGYGGTVDFKTATNKGSHFEILSTYSEIMEDFLKNNKGKADIIIA